jgi:hypothetical protein
MDMNEDDQHAMTALFFLVFAISSQSCPEDRDDIAEEYFKYAR